VQPPAVLGSPSLPCDELVGGPHAVAGLGVRMWPPRRPFRRGLAASRFGHV